jgi:hypothetical protein
MKKPIHIRGIGEPVVIEKEMHIPLLVRDMNEDGGVRGRILREIVLPLDKVKGALEILGVALKQATVVVPIRGRRL